MTGCALCKKQPDTEQVVLRSKCPITPKPQNKDFGGIVREYTNLLILYKECSEKHNALVDK